MTIDIDIDFAALMEPAARILLGEPNRALSSKNELRYGNKGSLSIVRAANYQSRLSRSGRRPDVISYITKQMTPQAWFKRGRIRKPGGAILGKRGGVSANLTWKAIAAWRRDRNSLENSAILPTGRIRRAC
jgi:hypothetical protein